MTHNALRLGRRSLFCGTALLTLASVTSMAYAQSNPGFVYGQVPTPAQWNSYFSAKLDVSNPQITGSMGFTANQVYNSPTITVPSITNYVETISGTIGGGLSAPRVPNPFINQQTITNGVTLNNAGGIYGWHWKETLNKATGSNSVALFELGQVNTTPADNGRTSSFEAAGFYVTMVAPAGGTLPAQTFANGFVYGINTKPFLSDGALNYSLLNGLGEVDLGISPVYNTITVAGSVTIGETDTIELASTNCGFPGGVILTATAASGDTPGIVLNKFFAQILANDTLSACGVGGAMAGATSATPNTLEITSPPNNLTGVVDLTITFPPSSGGASLAYTLAPVTTIGASAQTKVGMTIVELKKDGVAGAASNSVFGIAKQSGGAFPPTSGGWDNLITFIGTTNEFAPDDMTVVPGQWPLDRLFNGVIANIPTQYSGQNDTPLQFPRMSSWEDLPNVDFLLSDITTGLGPLVYPGFMLKGDGSQWIGSGTIQRLVGNAGTVGIQIQANGWEGTAVALSNGGGPGAGTLTGRYYINDITTCGFGDHEMVDTITAAGGIATMHVINDGTRFEYPSSGPGSAPSATCHPLGGSGAGAVYTITWSAGNTVTVGNSGGTVNLLGVVNGGTLSSNISAATSVSTFATASRTMAARGADVLNVKDFGATGDGTTDDAVAINAAFTEARAIIAAGPSGITGINVYFPYGVYNITAGINATGLNTVFDNAYQVSVIGEGSTVLCRVGSHACMDFLGDSHIDLRGMFIRGIGNGVTPPTTGFQFGRISSASSAALNSVTNVSASGVFSIAPCYSEGSEEGTWINVECFNVQNSASTNAVAFDGPNHFNIQSQFVTQTITADTPNLPFNDQVCIECNFRNDAGTGQAVWIGGWVFRLNLINSYAQVQGTVVPIVLDTSINAMYDLKLNVHSEIVTGTITNDVLIIGSGATPTIHGLQFNDQFTFAHGSVFGLGGSVTSVTITDAKIQVDGSSVTPTLFDTPANYSLYGDVTLPVAAFWSQPANFQGRVEASTLRKYNTTDGLSNGGGYWIGAGQALGTSTQDPLNSIFGGSGHGTVISTGSFETAFGVNSLANVTSGSFNDAFGNQALGGVTIGSLNVGIGNSACKAAAFTGSGNLCVGKSTGATLVSGSNNILVGNSIDVPAAATANYLDIGGAITGTNSNGAHPSVCVIGAPCVVAQLRSANFNATTDQAITVGPLTATDNGFLPSATKYKVTDIFVTNCSTSLTTAAGGFYTAISKGGTIIGATTTPYTACTSATTQQDATALTNMNTTIFTAGTIYLSLTTPQGGAATGDVYIVGVPFN